MGFEVLLPGDVNHLGISGIPGDNLRRSPRRSGVTFCTVDRAKSISLSNSAASVGESGREVFLVKKGRGTVPNQGFEKLIVVTSIPESPLLSLLLGIRHIYGPKFKSMQGLKLTTQAQTSDISLFPNNHRQPPPPANNHP
eukprot:313253-Amorphochlora_amoeboformis.AAC.2